MNELVTVEVQELKLIEQSKANAISETFSPMAARLAQFESDYNTVISESANGITDDLVKKAKRLRLDIGKIRIETGKIKDKQKEDIKLLDKAIMGVHNFLVLAVKEKEDKLSEIEKHFERIQQEKRDALQREREELISEYIDDAATRDLAGMDNLVWDAFFTTCKRNHEEKMAAEAKAEAERIENERLDNIERERRDTILPYRQFWTCDNYNLREMSEANFRTIWEDLKAFKREFDAKQKRILEDNERLQREKDVAEAKAAAERAERERIAKELQDKKDAEEKARKEKEDAEKKAARAPDKDKIASFIKAIESLPVPEVKTVEGKKLAQYIYNQLAALVTTLKQQNERM